ncbi:hypothetical protein IFM89_029025 [Coptis chinensis]|uniref:Uncharacterized protein n=1 Tax=Coptis chinensis TaxID=261450 RepID=A0A835IFX6_9MAGN|nr:hypothetical protein IFM89_029025 [Coptis chinensis]
MLLWGLILQICIPLSVCICMPRSSDANNIAFVVEGCGGQFPVGKESTKEVQLFLGNAGTTMHPLTAAVIAAGGNARWISYICQSGGAMKSLVALKGGYSSGCYDMASCNKLLGDFGIKTKTK